MKNFLIPLFLLCLLMNLNAQNGFQYPDTKKVNHVDEYFGVKVDDPYRWLEDDLSSETKEWVEAKELPKL